MPHGRHEEKLEGHEMNGGWQIMEDITKWTEKEWRKNKDYCFVSIQGLHPSKDPAFVVFEGELNGTV